MNLYIDMPMKDWYYPMMDADIGQIFVSMCGFFTTTFTLAIDDDNIVDLIAHELIKIINE